MGSERAATLEQCPVLALALALSLALALTLALALSLHLFFLCTLLGSN